MKNLFFIVLVIIILTGIGAVFYNWQGKEILVKDDAVAPSLAPQWTRESLPAVATQEPTPSFQKPAENSTFKMPIFNYHHIRPMPNASSSTISDRAFTVSPAGFEAHLKYFQDNGYQVVSVYDLLDYFDTGRPLPKKAVAITFDDATAGHYNLAFPLLKKYGVSATFFIVTDYIGKSGVLTWAQIKEMSDNGMFIGSHGASHANLTVISDEQARRELVESKKILEEKIGKKVDLLAYPGGNYNAHVIDLVKETGYQAALSVYKIIEQGPKFRYTVRRFHADDWLESIKEKLVNY